MAPEGAFDSVAFIGELSRRGMQVHERMRTVMLTATQSWSQIRNRATLTDHGPRRLREDAVDIIEHAIRAADPYTATRRLLRLDGHRLDVRHLQCVCCVSRNRN